MKNEGDFSGQLMPSSESLCAMLIALIFWFGPSQEIIIAGDSHKSDAKEMLKLIRDKFLPNAILLFHDIHEKDTCVEKEIPFLKEYMAIDGKATAYLCENYLCRSPVNNIDELSEILTDISRTKQVLGG